MKVLGKISLLIGLLFLVNIAFATETEVKEPDPSNTQQQGEKNKSSNDIGSSTALDGGSEPIFFPSIDSTENDSVSKYNFIFYFLYKLKYNEDREIEALF